jgi:hypothetical protein
MIRAGFEFATLVLDQAKAVRCLRPWGDCSQPLISDTNEVLISGGSRCVALFCRRDLIPTWLVNGTQTQYPKSFFLFIWNSRWWTKSINPAILYRAALVRTDVSEEHIASIFKVIRLLNQQLHSNR